MSKQIPCGCAALICWTLDIPQNSPFKGLLLKQSTVCVFLLLFLFLPPLQLLFSGSSVPDDDNPTSVSSVLFCRSSCSSCTPLGEEQPDPPDGAWPATQQSGKVNNFNLNHLALKPSGFIPSISSQITSVQAQNLSISSVIRSVHARLLINQLVSTSV